MLLNSSFQYYFNTSILKQLLLFFRMKRHKPWVLMEQLPWLVVLECRIMHLNFSKIWNVFKNHYVVLYFFGTHEQMWRDEFLSWNPELYNRTKDIIVASEFVWLPEIMIYNRCDPSWTNGCFYFVLSNKNINTLLPVHRWDSNQYRDENFHVHNWPQC